MRLVIIEGGLIGVQWLNFVFHFPTNTKHVWKQATRPQYATLWYEHFTARIKQNYSPATNSW